jgi:predicted phage tail protein
LAAGHTAALWWAAVPGATSYRIESGTVAGAADLAVVDVNASSASGMVPLGTYWVRVRAGNAWGWSPASADVRLVVDGSVELPLAPADLAATVSGAAVTLTWAPPSAGTLPSAYVVEAGSQPDALQPVATTPTTSIAAAAVPRGTYYVRVRAVTAAGAGPPTPTIVVVVP